MNRDELIRDIQKYLVSKGYNAARKGVLGDLIANYILDKFIEKTAFAPVQNLKADEKDIAKIKTALSQSLDNARIELKEEVPPVKEVVEEVVEPVVEDVKI